MATTVTQNPAPATATPPPPTLAWAQIIWFGALLVGLYFSILRPMVEEFSTQDEMGHGFFVPVVAGFIIWTRRQELAQIPIKTFWPALILVIWGFLQTIVGLLGAEFSVSRTGMFLSLVGVIWTLCGTQMLKELAFPLAVLLFAIRIPLFIYSQITFPLQIFASSVAEWALNAMGIPCLRNGNVLELANQKLSVVEACSGIRSLISLLFLSLVYGYFFETRTWIRIALFLLTVPIAIIANSARVTISGILYQFKKEWAEGFYHSVEGFAIFIIALIALYGAHQLLLTLDQRFVQPKSSPPQAQGA